MICHTPHQTNFSIRSLINWICYPKQLMQHDQERHKISHEQSVAMMAARGITVQI